MKNIKTAKIKFLEIKNTNVWNEKLASDIKIISDISEDNIDEPENSNRKYTNCKTKRPSDNKHKIIEIRDNTMWLIYLAFQKEEVRSNFFEYPKIFKFNENWNPKYPTKSMSAKQKKIIPWHIRIKLLKTSDKEKKLESSQIFLHTHYTQRNDEDGRLIRNNTSWKTVERKKIQYYLKKRNPMSKILYPAKIYIYISLINEGKIIMAF